MYNVEEVGSLMIMIIIMLSLSRVQSLSHLSWAAFISSWCSSGFGVHSSHHLSEAVEVFNSVVSLQDTVGVEFLRNPFLVS